MLRIAFQATFPLAVLAALSAQATVPSAGQDPARAVPASADTERIQKAIADYEQWKDQRGKDALRNKALLWLGEIDAPEVVDYLGRELTAAADTPFAAVVLQAIAKVPRKDLENAVRAVLLRESAPPHVRRAAADAAATMGDRAVDRLVDLATAGDDTTPRAVRDVAATALIARRDDRAIRALVRLLDGGKEPDLVASLRLFDGVSGVPPLDAARVRLVREARITAAAMAWRQLAEAGHERSKALALDVVEKLPEIVPPQAAADAIVGLSIVGEADFYPVLLRLGQLKNPAVRTALRKAADAAAKDPALLRFLATTGLEHEHPDARAAARLLLEKAPKEAVQPLVAKVRAALKRPKKESLDLAIGLHDLLAKDPSWRNDLFGLAAAKDPEVRTVGLSLLLDLGADTAIELAQDSLGSKAWQLRSIAIRYLARFRQVGSIPLLIARVDKEGGRLADELSQALFRHTGTRCFSRKEWEAWWRDNQRGFVLPHEDTVRTAVGSSSAKTSSYYDIPLVSTQLAFLIDHSGSMRARVGTDKKFTRLEAAKKQLAQVLEALPGTHHCNLIVYDTTVKPLWKELRKLDDENRKEILARVRQLQPAGGTNIFDSLETAYTDPSVDTIYLLTDGEPSAGRLTDPADILQEVRRWNRSRQVVVHCIAIGLESALLKSIAEETGGMYRAVK